MAELCEELGRAPRSSRTYTVAEAVSAWLDDGLPGRSGRTKTIYKDGLLPLVAKIGHARTRSARSWSRSRVGPCRPDRSAVPIPQRRAPDPWDELAPPRVSIPSAHCLARLHAERRIRARSAGVTARAWLAPIDRFCCRLDLCQLGGPGLPGGWPPRRSGIQPSMLIGPGGTFGEVGRYRGGAGSASAGSLTHAEKTGSPCQVLGTGLA